jgi:hypothetical protein
MHTKDKTTAESLLLMPHPTHYYSDDITLMPNRIIWQGSRLSGLFAPLMFSFFYLRKCLKLPFRPKFAAPYPTSLPIQSIDALPPQARDAFARTFPEMHASGLQLAFCTVTPFIGTKWGASAIFINAEGDIYASVAWIRIQLNAFDRAESTMSCHSLLPSGMTLTTGAISQNRWIPEMIPPNVSITRLPETSTLSEILRTHRERLRNQSQAPVRFDEQALQAQILTTMQALYDHLIVKNLYRKLTQAEVNRMLNEQAK